MKRTTDGEAMEYLAFTDGSPAWESSEPDTFFKFSEDTYASGYMPDSAYIDESVTGDSIAFWVRARDFYGNATSWVLCSLYVAGADFPDVGNVLNDDTVNGSPGTFANVSPEYVLFGQTWGADGAEFTGTYAPDFPSVGNVTTDDTVNGSAGTFAVPAVGDVKLSVGYGADGAEFTGTYALSTSSPDAPILSGLTPGDGEIVCAVEVNDAGDTAYILYRKNGDEWSDLDEDLSTSADGNVTITGLENGTPYFVVAVSVDGDFVSIPSVNLSATPTDSDGGLAIRVVDAVVAELNSVTFSQAFTATRTYSPILDFEDMDTLHVSASLGGDEITNLTREDTLHVVSVVVGIQIRFDTFAAAAIDPFVKFGREIISHFERNNLPQFPTARNTQCVSEQAYDDEMLRTSGLFSAEITLVYHVMD
jgi:hypothetical protein